MRGPRLNVKNKSIDRMENIMYKATVCLLILMTASSFAQDASRRANTTALAPRIVATVSLTGQTAGIAKTALFTPTNTVYSEFRRT